MDIHDLFERTYADLTGMDEEFPRMHRLSNGSYSLPKMAADFMYFQAGFEANTGNKSKRNTHKTGDE